MKNNKKKKIAVIAAIIAIIAIISAGTLAWFNDKDTKINKFAVSGGDGDFKVEVNETSKKIAGAIRGTEYKDEAGNVLGIDYTTTKLIPGSLISKQPFAINSSDLDINQWVRVLVTIPKASEWEAICEKYSITDLTTIFGGHDEIKWERLNSGEDLAYYIYSDTSNDTLTYAFYYNTQLAKGKKTDNLFETITIPGQLTASELQSITTNGYFNIVVEAHAVQATNNTAESAIAAFKAVNWPINATAPIEPTTETETE